MRVGYSGKNIAAWIDVFEFKATLQIYSYA